jgi:5'-nucleotidase
MAEKRILITNDDGMFAPGLKALVNAVKGLGNIIVVAPNTPQSGQGHAITITDPIRIHKVDVFPGVDAYECSGTPVDCVKLAKNVILKNADIDLCISGINHGSNASINIIYSGTMSAAMEASLEGINSVGFSLLDYSFEANFEPAKEHIRSICVEVLENGIQGCSLLNVNIPNVSRDEIKGVKVCRQAHGNWIEEFVEATDPRGQKYYWLTGKFVAFDKESDTDIWALNNNYISVVPSGHDMTRHDAIPKLSIFENLK